MVSVQTLACCGGRPQQRSIVIIGHGNGKVETRDINEGTVEEDRLDFVESDNLFSDLQD